MPPVAACAGEGGSPLGAPTDAAAQPQRRLALGRLAALGAALPAGLDLAVAKFDDIDSIIQP